MTPPSYFGSLRNTSGDANVKHRLTGPSGPLQGPQHVACSCSPRRFRDVQNLLCVVVRTLPNVIVFSVNLIVPEGLDTPNNMY